jgi:hypothetical protein
MTPRAMMHSHSDVTEAADLAVKKVFFILGVDVENAKSIEDFREDLRFGRKLRKLADHGNVGVVGILVLGLMTALWHGIVSIIKVTK